jgi:hypothetical protein
MIFLAASILLLFYNKPWMRSIVVVTWLIGAIVNMPVWPLYLVASGMFLVIWLIGYGIINHFRTKSNK